MCRGAGHRSDGPDDEDRDEGDDDVDEVFAAATHAQDAVRNVDGARQAHAACGQVRGDFTGQGRGEGIDGFGVCTRGVVIGFGGVFR